MAILHQLTTPQESGPIYSYGQGIGPDVLTIFVVNIDPLAGPSGSAGAMATMGPGDSGCAQSNENGAVVRLYCGGGGAYDQLTGSGVTLVGEAEKVPLAVNCIPSPFTAALIVIDWSCRLLPPPQATVKQVTSRRNITVQTLFMANSF